MRLLAIAFLVLTCAACNVSSNQAEVAALRAEVEELKSRPVAPAVELGQQMLELQIRHARLWDAGKADNWLLAQFQLAELRESLDGVVEVNGEHPSLQPRRLAEVLPEMMQPALKQMQSAIDANDHAAFEAAYDAVSEACSGCHTTADHGFLVIQRPLTPVLDNLRAAPAP